MIKDHHPGYITWDQFERNQKTLSENNFMRSGRNRKAGRGGHGLLTGLLRCRRCSRMLYTYYSGRSDLVRYMCRGLRIAHGGQSCISFAGAKPEQRVVAEILRAVEGSAVEAALQAAKSAANQEQTRIQALSLELELSRYQARLAQRRYESTVDLPTYDPSKKQAQGALTAGQAAERLGVSMRTVRELLRTNVLTGTQVVEFAPWRIPVEALHATAVVERVQRIHDGKQQRALQTRDELTLPLPGM